MKIDDSKKKDVCGSPLSSFVLGDCVRLVRDVTDSTLFLGCLYIVGASDETGRLAINLVDGMYRTVGQFVLEPNAKIVIE